MINAPVQTKVSVLGKVYTEEEVGLLAMKDLVAIYNNIAEITEKFKEVKKFSDHATAVKRTWAALLGYDMWWEQENAVEPVPAPELTPEEIGTIARVVDPVPTPRKGSHINFLGMRCDIAPSAEIAQVQKSSSIRGKALALLLSENGANLDQLTNIFKEADAARGKTSDSYTPRIYQMVRIFCHSYGYGTQSAPDGETIRLITERVKKA